MLLLHEAPHFGVDPIQFGLPRITESIVSVEMVSSTRLIRPTRFPVWIFLRLSLREPSMDPATDCEPFKVFYLHHRAFFLVDEISPSGPPVDSLEKDSLLVPTRVFVCSTFVIMRLLETSTSETRPFRLDFVEQYSIFSLLFG